MTIKIDVRLAMWLKKRSAERGAFIYELLEELCSRAIGGSTPWHEMR